MDLSTVSEVAGVVLVAVACGLAVWAVWPALAVLGLYLFAVGLLGGDA